jgi:EVE domain
VAPRTWILTGSPENYAATAAHGHAVIGCKERRRNQALQMEPGDRIVLYLTRVQCFAASMRLESGMFEDRTPVWPGKPGAADPYPWRFHAAPELVLDEPDWLPAETLRYDLEHIRKWPPEHWTLAFQGQLRVVSGRDAGVLLEAMAARAASGASVP